MSYDSSVLFTIATQLQWISKLGIIDVTKVHHILFNLISNAKCYKQASTFRFLDTKYLSNVEPLRGLFGSTVLNDLNVSLSELCRNYTNLGY